MTTSNIIAVYADGGVIGRNPSAIGGTWAFCAVDAAGLRLIERSGTLHPAECGGPVSNNQAEYYALVNALEAMPAGWSGAVCSDSMVSLGRIFKGWKTDNLPEWMVSRAQAAMARLGWTWCVLLDGHPTKAHLAADVGKRGHPVSEHNVWCDARCQEEARKAKEAQV